MRFPLLLAALLAPAAFAAAAAAAPAVTAATAVPATDARLDGMKQIERSACLRLGNTGPGAPKNLKFVPKYCECVAKAYWDNIPKAEVEDLMNTGQSAAMDQNRVARMAAARDSCQGK
ncbi:hypothetical protein LJR289_005116 [Pseudoduganella sp. LjRoot289]|uniref:hypothetical protein n=1 Tax=Pseudoduganella sp. LjRoot289 TaxID=3342314 RepID=UPI003ED03242